MAPFPGESWRASAGWRGVAASPPPLTVRTGAGRRMRTAERYSRAVLPRRGILLPHRSAAMVNEQEQLPTRFIDETEVRMAELMTPELANFAGNVHGGAILSQMDKVAYVCACRYAGADT